MPTVVWEGHGRPPRAFTVSSKTRESAIIISVSSSASTLGNERRFPSRPECAYALSFLLARFGHYDQHFGSTTGSTVAQNIRRHHFPMFIRNFNIWYWYFITILFLVSIFFYNEFRTNFIWILLLEIICTLVSNLKYYFHANGNCVRSRAGLCGRTDFKIYPRAYICSLHICNFNLEQRVFRNASTHEPNITRPSQPALLWPFSLSFFPLVYTRPFFSFLGLA